MKILCWSANESVWLHWCGLWNDSSDLKRTFTKEQTIKALDKACFDYCFIYLNDEQFSEMVENVVALRLLYPNLKIVAFPFLRSQAAGIRMLSAGVNAQCPPFVKADRLALILSVVDSGEIWGGKEFIQGLIQQSANSLSDDSWEVRGLECLSDRENTVAVLVSKGCSNKLIATEMKITERTVKAHLTAIYKKLSVKDRLSLALLVQQHAKSKDLS